MLSAKVFRSAKGIGDSQKFNKSLIIHTSWPRHLNFAIEFQISAIISLTAESIPVSVAREMIEWPMLSSSISSI